MKAAETDTSMSELVNEALRQSLADDADDLASFRSRSKEADMDFEEFVSALRQRGKL
jgi:Arc/MetJ-type ribon-helix-helix transcriptional regulator